MTKAHRKILIACFEVPGWGGASTATYKLFEMLQGDGLDVSLVNIISEQDSAWFDHCFGEKSGNPAGLDQVFNCRLSGNNYQYQAALHELIREIEPSVMVGVGWIAAHVLALAEPSLRLIYLTTGCSWMKMYIAGRNGNDYLSFERNILPHPERIRGRDRMEAKTLAWSDLVIAHSGMNRQLLQVIYPSCRGKLYDRVVWFSEWIRQDALSFRHLRKPFETRKIDVLFVASNWSRTEKNPKLARRIQQGLHDLNVHVVGEAADRAPGVTYHSFVPDRETLFGLMGDSRVVVCPSAFDAAPGILFEASAMQCNVVASRNCGNWRICHHDLLVDPASLQGYLAAVWKAVTREYTDGIDFFEGRKCYEDLKDLLSFF